MMSAAVVASSSPSSSTTVVESSTPSEPHHSSSGSISATLSQNSNNDTAYSFSKDQEHQHNHTSTVTIHAAMNGHRPLHEQLGDQDRLSPQQHGPAYHHQQQYCPSDFPLKNNGDDNKSPSTNSGWAVEPNEEGQYNSNHNGSRIAAAREEVSTGDDTTTFHLPPALQHILSEVASTGTCSWLPWSVLVPREEQSREFPSLGVAAHHRDDDELQSRSGPSHGSQQTSSVAPSTESSSGASSSSSSSRSDTAAPSLTKKLRNGMHAENSLAHTTKRRSAGDGLGEGTSTCIGGAIRRKRPRLGGTNVSIADTALSETDNVQQSQLLQDSEDLSASGMDACSGKMAFTAKSSSMSRLSERYSSQNEAFREALQLVLEYFYRRKGGYRLSPAERRMIQNLSVGNHFERMNGEGHRFLYEVDHPNVGRIHESDTAHSVFVRRRRRLLDMLSPSVPSRASPLTTSSQPLNEPPFTLQRVAEILIAPERFYSQTHKVCNALEKLLLIASSSKSFGGVAGGDNLQSRREEQELAALADEQKRIQSELRNRRLRQQRLVASLDRKTSASPTRPRSDRDVGDTTSSNHESENDAPSDDATATESGNTDLASRELLEAAARASLRTKFDHVGIDPHSASVVNRDVRAIAESRGMTNSPPPPGLSMAVAAPAYALLRHHGNDQELSPPGRVRALSPILFGSPTSDGASSSPPMGPVHPSPSNIHLLQIHHASALAGVSPFELMSLHRSSSPAAPSGGLSALMPSKEVDIESRSSASSDVDSESDVSFDDSASDRSDGSDSGHFEPFSTARAMTLTRMQQQQQQQQRLQSRMQLQPNQNDSSFRGECDYPAADGHLDAARGEDSGGSDSSASDLAD